MSDIFISYASEDRERILPLVHALEKTGWSIFWDRKIRISQTWHQAIGEEIDQCRCMIVAWSNTSVKSEWVYEEAGEGKRRQILFPLLIDDVLPPLGFRSIQAGKLIGWDENGENSAISKLIQDMSHVLGEPLVEQITDSKLDQEDEFENGQRIHSVEAYMDQRDYDKALDLVDRALKAMPSQSMYIAKARILKKMGRYDEAIEVCTVGINLTHGSTSTKGVLHYNRACYRSLAHQGIEAIIADLEDAVLLNLELMLSIEDDPDLEYAREFKELKKLLVRSGG